MPLLMLWQGADSPLVFDPHQLVTAQLLDYNGAPVAGEPLENAFGIVFYDEWDGPGNGQCSLALSEAGSAELLPGRYVNCKVNGIVRFTFMIEGNPEYRVIQKGEEYDQVMTVRGRGWGALFDTAIIYPEYSLQTSLETTWRLFSFASILFPNAGGWGAAVEQAEYLDGVVEFDCYGHAQLAPDGNKIDAPITVTATGVAPGTQITASQEVAASSASAGRTSYDPSKYNPNSYVPGFRGPQ